MRKLIVSFLVCLLQCGFLSAAEVEIASPKPARTAATKVPTPTTTPGMPMYRPALLGTGPASVINRIDTKKLIEQGQKDGSLMFCCSVKTTGEIVNTWIYRQSPDTAPLQEELFRCLDTAVFVPAIFNHRTVHTLFFGTVTFKVVNGKPRLRIFANQEASELEKESDFVGPQPFVGRESKFEGLHYPGDVLTRVLSGIVELALTIDADGNLKDLKMVSEHPPLAGFGRAATEDFRVARFIPAYRDGKPIECNITLPVYYEP